MSDLGKKLNAKREKAIAGGMGLLSEDEILALKTERRGEKATSTNLGTNPTVDEIVADFLPGWLKGHGYDGLWSEVGECGCKLDDLRPCCSDSIDECQAGYLGRCADDDENKCEGCACGGSWHIGPEKPGI